LARKVLLADDSVTAQNMGRRILIDAGYEVITVNNGSSAIKKVSECKPDLIVLDVYMPGYGGLEVCQRIRESQETSRIPVLLTVGKLEPFKAEEARRVRADAFIVKPFEASELLTALTKLEDKIVPSRKRSKNFADEEPGASRQFGDVDGGWKNRLKIPPPHHPHSQQATAAEERVPEPVASDSPTSPGLQSQAEATNAATVEASTNKEQTPASEFSVAPESNVAESSLQISVAPATETNSGSSAKLSEFVGSHAEQRGSHDEDVAAALAALAPIGGHTSEGPEIAAEAAPATMAIAGDYSGPRWVAEEVTLSDDESAMTLEHEMHKAFAAFAAADAARMAVACPSQSGDPAEEAVTKADSSRQPDGSNAEPASYSRTNEVQQAEAPPVETSETQTVPESEATEQSSESSGAAFAAAASAGGSEPTNAVSQSTSTSEHAPPSETKQDSDLAAAWASWKQVRESVATPGFTSQLADAAAAGAHELKQDERSASSEGESATGEETAAIAGIVDSVLAELKPKLMEEISKKIKKPKK